ncbi:hypothetical protein A3J44_00035 [candidate division WOR-1 bacterium RIFCSPHIGHO2_02_FULL_45_12]|nr:MAG: hypothetical protein A3J44_00035 [candidate division WOR-1 bacterium RIFCSPHIGHO2_02_FULL_45_12]
MLFFKRSIISVILLDNFLTHFPKKLLFKTRWRLEGKCKQCGACCQEIYLKITPRQLSSKLFTALAVKWIGWVFDFILLRVDYDNYYLVWTCKHKQAGGRCGNYFWRPSVCRNFPLVDYFDEPGFIPGCGYGASKRNVLTSLVGMLLFLSITWL